LRAILAGWGRGQGLKVNFFMFFFVKNDKVITFAPKNLTNATKPGQNHADLSPGELEKARFGEG
jgi:hypothetical protein